VGSLRKGFGPLALALASILGASTAQADSLTTEPAQGNAGYIPVEELSYEIIIQQGTGYTADVRLRVALHNSSSEFQDAVVSFGLPHGAELMGMRVARGGEWSQAEITDISPVPDPRGPGMVFARRISPATSGDIPGAEVAAFGIESGATIQVELQMEVNPTLRGERWHLDLPHRGLISPVMAADRRVIVKGLKKGEDFYVDGISNDGSPVMLSQPTDSVSVSWPAHARAGALLGGLYEVTEDTFGKGGTFRLSLRLGQSTAAKPDHLIVMVDRSRSAGKQLQRDTYDMLEKVFDSLPSGTTFEAIGFARDAHLMLNRKSAKVRSNEARRELKVALRRGQLDQGTNIEAGLELAAQRLRLRRAKRPMVMIVTDGMLPVSANPDVIASNFRKTLGTRRAPEVLFVVDDPLLERSGLPSDHPVATSAAALGARISLEKLSHVATEQKLELLSAPKVLGDLAISLPRRAILHDDVPEGLVAGNFLVLEGRYEGRAPASVSIRGKLGKQTISTKLKAHRTGEIPAALVAATHGPERLPSAIAEGFALPTWYTRRMLREARTQITQAGRAGHEVAGQLDASIFRRYLRQRVLPRSRVCFNRALSRNQTQSGRAMLDIEVGKGEVIVARVAELKLSDSSDPAFAGCLEDAAWALDIPAGHLDDRIYRIRYPISFVAPEGGRPPSTAEGKDPIFEMLMERADVLAQ
jgi:hypothetical protein